jgi:quinol monooxygenase YgiN
MPTDLLSTHQVYWLIVAKIHPGRAADFKAHSARLVASTLQENGALSYEWNLSPDGTHCHIYERYVDSDAVQVHGQRNAELVKQLYGLCTMESFTVYGAADAAVRERLGARGAVFMQPLGGFSR